MRRLYYTKHYNDKNLIMSTDQLTPVLPAASNTVTEMVKAIELASNPEVVKELHKYGNVPVVYRPTRSMVRRPADPGLSHLIANAMTANEVNNLLKKGKEDYKNAQPKTIRRWEKAAANRIVQLK